MAQTIKFNDGYTVTLEEKKITIKLGGRTQKADPLHLHEVKEGGSKWEMLKSKGVNPADFLTDGDIVVRRGNGVAEAVAEITKERRKEREKIQRETQARRDAMLAAEQILIDDAKKRANEIRAQIGENEIEVKVQEREIDGFDMSKYFCEGVKIDYKELKYIGSASATREGAYNPFYSEKIYTISRARLQELKNEKEQIAQVEETKTVPKKTQTVVTQPENKLPVWDETEDAEWNDDQNFWSPQNPFFSRKKKEDAQFDENDAEQLAR